jgi:meiotically up-regulated gene 157 (Mug157) protein
MSASRRDVLLAAGASAALFAMPAAARAAPFVSRRPGVGERRFVSKAVEAEIRRVTPLIGDPELAWLFENCYPNTLDTTIDMGRLDGKPDTFVITGDIPCMWLRDSSAQVNPYVHLAADDEALRLMFRGLIARQARCILIDPYANAFMKDTSAPTSLNWARKDDTKMAPGVAERKWEIDSLCYPMRLAHSYWSATGDVAPFDAEWLAAMHLAVATLREQQRLEGPGRYRFLRPDRLSTETLMLNGYGAPTRKIGLIHSMFRPSDDACIYPFLIPANHFAARALRLLAQVAATACNDAALAADATQLAGQVEAALRAHGTMRDTDGAQIWAYEVDGYGNAIFMDDANVPSLSALAYLGCVAPDDPLFRRTAQRAWSPRNPYFFTGTAAEGIGGPHAGLRMIWPMAIIMHALNSNDNLEIVKCLQWLKATHAGTGFMHEAFDQDDPANFTRDWFAWANGLFGELILDLLVRKPGLVASPLPPAIS